MAAIPIPGEEQAIDMSNDTEKEETIQDTGSASASQTPETPRKKGFMRRLVENRTFSYMFMVSLLVYIIVCGYVLFFSGSLFIEAILKGWYKASATEYDSSSFLLGYLYGFPSLLGIIGGLLTLSSNPRRFFRFKVLLFFPSLFWSMILVLDLFRWGTEYWTQALYIVPIFLLCVFIFFCVVKCAPIPYHALPESAD